MFNIFGQKPFDHHTVVQDSENKAFPSHGDNIVACSRKMPASQMFFDQNM
jgi:hypothetical protein